MSTATHSAGFPRVPGDLRGSAPAGAKRALQAAGACVVALALVWAVAELIPAAHVRDAILLRHFTVLNGPSVDRLAGTLLDLLDPLPLVVWGSLIVLYGLVRGRHRESLAAAAIIVLSPASADRLKPLLAHAHSHADGVHIGAASWPSGHAAAALALVLAAMLLVSRRARPVVATVGAAFALAVGCALLIQGWHMPSDVLGGYLVAGLWTALAVAGLRVVQRGRGTAAAAKESARPGTRAASPAQPAPEPWAPGSHSGSDPS